MIDKSVALVVIPALNEEQTIAKVVRDVRSLGLDVLVVDDGSTDQTAAVARAHGARVARLATSLGVGGALRTAFRIAVSEGYDVVVQCDGDGQHPTGSIPNLLAEHEKTGALLIIGSRFLPIINELPVTNERPAIDGKGPVGLPFRLTRAKGFGLAILRRRIKRRTGAIVTDPTSGFRVIANPLLTEFATNFPATYLGDTFEAIMAAAELIGPEGITEVGVNMQTRQGGVPFAKGPYSVFLFLRALLATGLLVRPRYKRLANR